MNIGSVTLKNKAILAPLAGITNLPFRLLAKEAGCALVCSEMVSAHGLINKSKRTEQMLDSLPEEKPLSVQIFGSQPDVMAEAARFVESSGADIIDIACRPLRRSHEMATKSQFVIPSISISGNQIVRMCSYNHSLSRSSFC